MTMTTVVLKVMLDDQISLSSGGWRACSALLSMRCSLSGMFVQNTVLQKKRQDFVSCARLKGSASYLELLFVVVGAYS